MPRCCSGTALVAMESGERILVEGAGTPNNPFIIHAESELGVQGTQTFALTLSGAGTNAQPWQLSVDYAETARLTHLPDVDADAPAPGQVLGWDAGAAKWRPQSPSTAPAGAVVTDSSMLGDGSAGTPLQVRESADGYISTVPDGLTFTDMAINATVRKFGDEADRDLADPAPNLNAVSMLDSRPGHQDYWTGTEWKPVVNSAPLVATTALLEMSGAFVDGDTVTTIVRQVTGVTDEFGQLEILPPEDLTGRAGVLMANFQEGGTVPFKALVSADFNRVLLTAYRIEDATLLVGQEVTGFVHALVY